MKDIDLDELDRAVGQMMSGKKKDSKASSEDKNLADKESDESAKTPLVDSGAETPKLESPKEPELPAWSSSSDEPKDQSRSNVQITPHKRGGIMDVVPKNTPRDNKSAAKPNRSSLTVQPPRRQDDSEQNKPPAANHEEHNAQEHDAPDLSYGGYAGKHEESPIDHHEDKEEKHEPPKAHDELNNDTPFLNTKVEKRPLGAFNSSNDERDELAKTPEPKQDDEPYMPSTPEQKELSPELVAAEASETPFEVEKPTTFEPAKDFKYEPKHESKHESKHEAEHHSDSTDLKTFSNMPIPQQYNKVEKPANTDSRSVFDTKDYHTPLTPPGKEHHKNGVWVVMLVIVSVISAGLIVAAFMVMNGQLVIPSLF